MLRLVPPLAPAFGRRRRAASKSAMRSATPVVFLLVAAGVLAFDRQAIDVVTRQAGRLGDVVGRRADAAALLPGAAATALAVASAASAEVTTRSDETRDSTVDEWGHLSDEGGQDADADIDPDERDDAAQDADDEEGEDGDNGMGDGPPVIVSTARETWVYAEPRWGSRRLGYLRAGAVVGRSARPAGYRSCKRGWFAVEPRGYVCAGVRASLHPDAPVARLSKTRPRLTGLPYPYVLSRYPTPPLYARLPTLAEQRGVEPDLEHKLAKHARLAERPDFVEPPAAEPVPDLLANGGTVPALGGVARGSMMLLGQARVRSGFALLASYQHEGRQFGLTTDMALVPLDGTRVVAPSTLRGLHLSDELELPVAIVKSQHARRYRLDAATGAFAFVDEVTWRSWHSLTGKTKPAGGIRYLESKDDHWLRADQIVQIERLTELPRWAARGTKWIDVSILNQTLVAYEGDRAVFATLVSTGADGLMDHDLTHATIQGSFLIHTKHVSVTMDGDEQGDEFDLRDVPFVQYFTEGYALHGAYWHDDFGTPRSHGCVNLAPHDAAWLFGWTDPRVPSGWHAALELKRGTVVYIHP